MRSSWEDGGKADLDEPTTITERQLRSLKRGARAGVLGMLLALVAAGAAGWSLLMGPDALAGIEGVQNAKMKVLSALGQSRTEAEQTPAPPPPPTSTQVPVGPASPDSSASGASTTGH